MANLSRTQKYKELRERLQNDTEPEVHSSELSEYESRLNRIDANNFAAPSAVKRNESREGNHARREPSTASVKKDRDERPGYQNLSSNENYTSPSFDNDYLNRYIQEVKQYNIDQGNAVSDKTEVNILNNLHNSRSGSRPFSNTPSSARSYDDFEDTGDGNAIQTNSSGQPSGETSAHSLDYTDQLRREPRSYQPSYNDDFTNDLDFDDDIPVENTTKAPEKDNQNVTREDIMAQVQSMVSGRREPPKAQQPQKAEPTAAEESRPALDDTRRQLINETSQMRAQLDDYGDNLNEVSDRMRHTNQILNTVLIVLIMALAVVLGVVIFWIIRG